MRKSVLIVSLVAAGAITFCVLLANISYISVPVLVIKFNGKPASNAALILPVSGDQTFQLDDKGSIKSISRNSNVILIRKPDGGGVSVRFPKHGTKTIDFRKQLQTVTLVQYFGLVRHDYEQVDLTNEQVAEIKSGRKTLAEIEQQIRDQAD